MIVSGWWRYKRLENLTGNGIYIFFREKVIGGRFGWSDRAVRKYGLVKSEVTRYDDIAGGNIIAMESMMVSGITKKDVRSRARLEFL